jgi:hypothetical protein
MPTIEFYFKPYNEWTMGPACAGPGGSSINPAPSTTGCIYIIHNSAENTTYVGYADDANDRWKTRTEVFHIMGIPQTYGQKILCAYCKPTSDGPSSILYKDYAGCEHLLIRAVMNGLLGPTTCTNTQLGNWMFPNPYHPTGTQVRVYLPKDPWGKLQGRKQATFGKWY